MAFLLGERMNYIIINKDNTVDDLTSDQVKNIFTGKVTTWDGLSD